MNILIDISVMYPDSFVIIPEIINGDRFISCLIVQDNRIETIFESFDFLNPNTNHEKRENLVILYIFI